MRFRYRIYFIHRPDTNEIKIGYTEDVGRRFNALQSANGSPLVLMGSMMGGCEEEQAIHEVFAGCRKLGEWFDGTPELRAYVARVLQPRHDEMRAACRHIAESLAEVETAREPLGEEEEAFELTPQWAAATLRAMGITPKVRTLSDLTPAELKYMNDHPVLGPGFA